MVGTPNVWWVWSGGAPPTTCFTSDEDRYSESGARDMDGEPPPIYHAMYNTVFCKIDPLHVHVYIFLWESVGLNIS